MGTGKSPLEKMVDNTFWKGKRVFLTGHTGFKGTWLSHILVDAGAIVTGYSLKPAASPNLFSLCSIKDKVTSIIGDIRDLDSLKNAFLLSKPEIIIHMAAQPIVRESYANPIYTYETNVIGTANILECARLSNTTKSFLNITTDKVYKNHEWEWGYRETDSLNGLDPYSNSKSCSELITDSYRQSFLLEKGIAVSTARSGNVIGGGDFAIDRIIPDCVRAAEKNENIIVRNPLSTRPYQHVLEPLFAYLLIAQKQYENINLAGSYNVGPNESDCITTGNIVDIFCSCWGENMSWENRSIEGPYEANFLKLDCSKIKFNLGWQPKWDIYKAVNLTVDWTKRYFNGEDPSYLVMGQVKSYYENN